MKKLYQYILFFVLIFGCSNIIYKQSNEPIKKDINSILDENLKKFVQNFNIINQPFELNSVPFSNEINSNDFIKLIKSESDDGTFINRYYYGYVFFGQNYLVLLSGHFYTTGISGLEDLNLQAHTYNYDGKLIDYEKISCVCKVVDLGSNEAYSTSFDKIEFDNFIIKVFEINTHATLLPEETENTFKKIKYDTLI